MDLTRRAVLLGGGALLAGCRGDRGEDRPAVVDPDVALRAAAVDRERGLLSAYDAALAAAPPPSAARAAALSAVRAEHAAHLEALEAAGSRATGTAPPVAAPAGSLPTLERAAAAAHARDTARCSPALAALLAQLAASEASHPLALA